MNDYDDETYSSDISGVKRPRSDGRGNISRRADDIAATAHAGTPAFLLKTFEIVSTEPFDCIRWSPDGTAIQILDTVIFSERVLPRYFKHNNFQSFVRQLNMYSFTKTRHDANWREFHHPYFRRGHAELLPLIKRKTHPSVTGQAPIPGTKVPGLASLLSPQSVFTTQITEEDWERGGEDAGRTCTASSRSSTVSSAAKDAQPGLQIALLAPLIDALTGSSTAGPTYSSLLACLGVTNSARSPAGDAVRSSGAGAMPEEPSPSADDPISTILRSPGALHAILSAAGAMLDSYVAVPAAMPEIPIQKSNKRQPVHPEKRMEQLESQVASLTLLVHRLVSIISMAAFSNPGASATTLDLSERPAKRSRISVSTTPHPQESALAALAEMGSVLADVNAMTATGRSSNFSGGTTLASLECMAADAPFPLPNHKTAHARVVAASSHDPSPRMAVTQALTAIPESANDANPSTIAAQAAAASSMANMMRLTGVMTSYKLNALASPRREGAESVGNMSTRSKCARNAAVEPM